MENPWQRVSPQEAYAEAERRIATASESNGTLLELGDLPLETLPPALGQLTSLLVLSLGRQRPVQRDTHVDWEFDGYRPGFLGADLSPLSGLGQLTNLDLSWCEQLTDLQPLSGLGQLTSLKLSGCRQLTDLQPLSGLGQLTDLNLSWCGQLSDLQPLSGLQELAGLYLSWCGRLTDLQPLSGLGPLTHLNLSWCGRLTDLQPLSGLGQLTNLDLSSCEQLTDLPPLSGLGQLTNLDLSSCEQLIDLPPLSGLGQLTDLNLSSCGRLTDLQPLCGLEQLTDLNLSKCGQITELQPLSGLVQLTSLNLSRCGQLTDLQPLSGLGQLTHLDLSWCGQLTDLQSLSGLGQLTDLNLSSCGRLTDLQPLSGLQQLTNLNLSWCALVTDLQPLSGLGQLTHLDVSWCEQLTDLQPLSGLGQLTDLDLSDCGVASFEPVRPLLNHLTRLYLFGTHTELDEELTGTDVADNVADKVRSHYDDLVNGAASEVEVKVFILGNGGVGKTQLVRRLKGEPFQAVASTHGIQCRHVYSEELGERQLAGWDRARFNLWDFGGQDIYHGSHALFLHGQAIFLILWNPDKESGEWSEAGVTMQNRPLAYWLDYVRTLAGPHAPVLVIQSRCDTLGLRRRPPLPKNDGFDFLRSFPFSALEGKPGLTELKGQLRTAADTILSSHRRQIGKGRAEVRRALRNVLERDQQLASRDRKHRTISRQTYEKLCNDVRAKGYLVTNSEALLDYLHRTGVVYYHPQRFGGRIVLDQEWALEAIYALFHREEVYPHLVNNGRFTRRLLHDLIWSKPIGNGPYSADDQELFIEMMQQCGICFRVNPEHGEKFRPIEGIYVAAELLPSWKVVKAHHYAWADRQPCDASATLKYRFLHEGIFRGLLSKIGERAGEGAHYAKQACGFHDQGTDCDVLIEAIPMKTSASPGAGSIQFRAWGDRARELIETMLDVVPQLTIDQPTLKRSWRKPRLRNSAENRPEDPAQDLSPVKGKVYLSYGWGEEGDLRQKVALEIVRRVREWGYEPVYDVIAVRSGDKLSAFMKEIARGNKVIVVMSAKYLRSPFCINELNLIDVRELRDEEEFRKRVIPIVLEDAAIGTPAMRAAHIRHWKQELKALRKHRNDLGPSDRVLCENYASWVENNRLGELLSWICDQLHPHNIKELDQINWDWIKQRLD